MYKADSLRANRKIGAIGLVVGTLALGGLFSGCGDTTPMLEGCSPGEARQSLSEYAKTGRQFRTTVLGDEEPVAMYRKTSGHSLNTMTFLGNNAIVLMCFDGFGSALRYTLRPQVTSTVAHEPPRPEDFKVFSPEEVVFAQEHEGQPIEVDAWPRIHREDLHYVSPNNSGVTGFVNQAQTASFG